MGILFAAFLWGFVIVTGLVPILRKIALAFGFVDQPTGRKIHGKATPLLGGVALFAAIAGGLLVLQPISSLTFTVITGGTAIMVIGLMDDWYKTKGREFPVWPRLLVYGAASTVPYWYGIDFHGVSRIWEDGMRMFPAWMSLLATALWVFGLSNMINFIDGVDGLASGIVTISAMTLLVVSLWTGQSGPALLAALMVGACLAFLKYNFHPAQIFMGDAGAVFLGYTLGVLALAGSLKSATLASIVISFLAMGVPIMDTALVFTKRLLNRQGLHRADKEHAHHRLMNWGLTQPQTVSFLYLIGGLFSLLSLILLLVSR